MSHPHDGNALIRLERVTKIYRPPKRRSPR